MNSILDNYKQLFINCASGLGDYENISETDLANGYCEAEEAQDEVKKSQYYSALMLKYWYKIYMYKQSSESTRLQTEDFIEWLEEALNIAFQYKEWRNPDSPIYKDPKAVDKIINRCCFSVRGLYYQNFNKDKRKINYLCESIESQIEQFGEAAKVNVGVEEEYDVINLINDYLSQYRYQEAVVIDGISFQNSFKEEKYNKDVNYLDEETGDFKVDEEGNILKTTKSYSRSIFDKRKLVKELTHLNKTYWDYFKNKYSIPNEESFNLFINSFSKIQSSKMYSIIDNTLLDLKENANKLI